MFQLAQHSGESHFSIARLEAVTHRGAHPGLRLRFACSEFMVTGL